MPLTSPANVVLVVDAGNTRIKFALFEGAAIPGQLPRRLRSMVIGNQAPGPVEAFLNWLGDDARSIGLTIGAGTFPEKLDEVRAALPADLPAMTIISLTAEFPLAVQLESPETVGIDRLLSAVAANHVRTPGRPAVIIDSGTASTLNYVDPQGRFRGGSILPGMRLSAFSLHEHTARLPFIDPPRAEDPIPDIVGTNTTSAIRSGLYWGHVGAVKEILRQFLHRAAQESADDSEGARHLGNLATDDLPLVLVTGGGAGVVLPHLPHFCRHEPFLAMQGAVLVALNR